ncbi:3-deoxy-D-manno-octulosonic acid transferase [Phycisphaerales bacterium AB-hyl4]|uniref:3-deoxy-D-manno-octulosonic acid transferase n=1 Tax=Natronomicrosphaera hydrolytica TaxID=3242702 RepID=A0ABV4U1L2_9BACT
MGLPHDITYAAAALATSPVWAYRMWRTGKWRTDWGGRFGRGEPVVPMPNDQGGRRRRLLIHAVSVGEVNAIRQLVDLLHREHGDRVELVIATTTDTGYARARELFAADHSVVRYPLDFTVAVRRFLDRVRPSAVALVELEVWPNFVDECKRRDIPIVVINGRLSARSFSRYRYLRPVVRSMFASLAAAAVQTPDYAQRFIAMGTPADRVHVLDTMKWDTAEVADDVPNAGELAEQMGIDRAHPLVVAGSTGPGEERLLIDAIRAECPPETQLLLVPRKPERFDEVAALDATIIRRSDRKPTAAVREGQPAHTLFLLDTMGELRKAYALADVVVIGRSFNGLGGSDPIEPIALSKPTIVGPDHHNFADVVHAFEKAGGIVATRQLGPAIAKLLANPDQAAELARHGRDVILSRQGSTQRHAELLLKVLGLADTSIVDAAAPSP